MQRQNTDIDWNRLMLQGYSYNLLINTCSQWRYIIVLRYMSVPTLMFHNDFFEQIIIESYPILFDTFTHFQQSVPF